MEGDVGSNLEWIGLLEASRTVFYRGPAYTQECGFSYSLNLRPSLTFGPVEWTEERTYARRVFRYSGRP